MSTRKLFFNNVCVTGTVTEWTIAIITIDKVAVYVRSLHNIEGISGGQVEFVRDAQARAYMETSVDSGVQRLPRSAE